MILASIVFFIMLLGFGIPVWWYTTAVHRANLPELETLDFAPENQRIYITFKTNEDTQTLSEKLTHLKNTMQKKCKYMFSYLFLSINQSLIIFSSFPQYCFHSSETKSRRS